MTVHDFDVVGIGNAIVDILAYTDEAFLKSHNLHKGHMTLVDEKAAARLYDAMGTATECSGGSVANTVTGMASLGAKTAFIGKIKSDQFGEIFRHDMTGLGVYYNTWPADTGKSTAQCLVFVTHDGASKIRGRNAERTMATFLGASTQLTKEDIDADVIKGSKVTYIEGYLWDEKRAQDAVMEAIKIAHEHDRKVAFSLSDPFCVERHKDEFLRLINDGHIDILFANEKEATALVKEKDIRKILYWFSGKVDAAAITRSEKGSYIATRGGYIYAIEPERVDEVYDVTGAGDLYAAGVLYGFVTGLEWDKAGRLGALCAAEVIKYLGGRPLTDLSKLPEKL
jgi:sugar/nucleoside kinase (ribokinase family)